MSLYSSYGEYGNAASPKPSADAWVVFEEVSGSNPVIIDSSGVSSVSRVQAGVRRVNFSNPERFGNGAFAAIATQEIGDGTIYGQSDAYAKFPALCIPHGITSVDVADPPYTAGGASASCDLTIIGFAGSSTAPSSLTDTSTSYKVRTNIAFFCLRSDTDTNKTAVANLLKWSERFDITGVGGWDSTTSTNYGLDTTIKNPLGGDNVFYFDGVGTSNYIAQAAGYIDKPCTFSVYAKAGTGLTVDVLIGGGGNNFGYLYDLSTGVLTTTHAVPPTGTTWSGYIQDVGEGWKRCVLQFSTKNFPAPLVKNNNV